MDMGVGGSGLEICQGEKEGHEEVERRGEH